MSSFEIVLIVLACAVPCVALFFVLPKKLKGEKKSKKEKKSELKTYEELKKEETKEEPKTQEQSKVELEKKKEPSKVATTEISTDDFSSYLKRRKNPTKPSRIELPKDFLDRTSPYAHRRKQKEEQKPKNVAEEIRLLSPELKALLIAGVLDPKNFDKD